MRQQQDLPNWKYSPLYLPKNHKIISQYLTLMAKKVAGVLGPEAVKQWNISRRSDSGSV